MDLLIVLAFSLFYLLATRLIPPLLVDVKKMREVRKRHRAVTKEMIEAIRSADPKKMDEATRKQEELNKEMLTLLSEQLKLSVLTIGLFLAFAWGISYFDPLTKDDQKGTEIFIPKAKLCYIGYDHKKYFIEDGNLTGLPREISVENMTNGFLLKAKKEMESDSCTATVFWLPFNVLGLKYIHGATSVFIFFSFILSFILAPVLPRRW